MASKRELYEAALREPAVRAFLNTIGTAEGATYDTMVYGGKITDFAAHPNVRKYATIRGKRTPSSAAGKYQMIKSTYDGLSKVTGLRDFSPHSQDINAIALLDQTGALKAIREGRIGDAIAKAGTQWAGLGGSSLAKAHNQPSRTMAATINTFRSHLMGAGVPQATADALVFDTTPPENRQVAALQARMVTPESSTVADDLRATLPEQDITGKTPEDMALAFLDRTTKYEVDQDDLLQRFEQAVASAEATQAAAEAPVVNTAVGLDDITVAQIMSEADAARENAVASVVGDSPSRSIRLPQPLENAINIALRNELNGNEVG